jgi:hypothetical protein
MGRADPFAHRLAAFAAEGRGMFEGQAGLADHRFGINAGQAPQQFGVVDLLGLAGRHLAQDMEVVGKDAPGKNLDPAEPGVAADEPGELALAGLIEIEVGIAGAAGDMVDRPGKGPG